jgi:hypothetical protein
MLAKEILYLSGKNKHPVYRSSISGHPYMRLFASLAIKLEFEKQFELNIFKLQPW